MGKIVLIVALFFSSLVSSDDLSKNFPNLTKENIEYYKKQVLIIENEIDKDFVNFDNLTNREKIKFKIKVRNLIPADMLAKNFTKDKHGYEFISLYKSLMNYKAYIFIDKFRSDYYAFRSGVLLSEVLKSFFPNNIAYKDTYLWGQVKDSKYSEALEEYPKLLKVSKNDKEIQKHYKYVLNKIKFIPKEAVQTIKKIIKDQYYTNKTFDKKELFQKLDSVSMIENKDDFIQNTNVILKQYTKNEIIIFRRKHITNKKKTKTKWLKYHIKDDVLYLKPNLLSQTIYDEIKEAIQKNKYKKIVLDLRGNDGGLLNSIINVISAFLVDNRKNIFIVKTKYSEDKYRTNSKKTLDTKSPLEIQIDKKTSRGALYIASVLSKEKRATIDGIYNKIDNGVKRVIPLTKNFDMLLKFQTGYTLGTDMRELKIFIKSN